jgi:hypothetical protein
MIVKSDRVLTMNPTGEWALRVDYFVAMVHEDPTDGTLVLIVHTWATLPSQEEGALGEGAKRIDSELGRMMGTPHTSGKGRLTFQETVEEAYRKHDTWVASR